MGPKTVADLEQCRVLKAKFETFNEGRKAGREALDRVLAEKKILEEEEPSEEEVKELLKQAVHLKLDYSKEGLARVQGNLQRTETLLGLKQEKCRAAVAQVEPDGHVCKVWLVELLPDEDNPDVVIKQKIWTRDPPGSDQLPSVQRLQLSVQGLDVGSELERAVEMCEEEREPQLFSHLVAQYLGRARHREALLRGALGKYCVARPNNSLEFRNSVGVTLALVTLGLEVDLRQAQGWTLTWRAKLTKEGGQACTTLHLPKSLYKSGTVKDWSPQYALETLGKVARLDAETPRKESITDVAASPRGETPRAEPEKRARKKKLAM